MKQSILRRLTLPPKPSLEHLRKQAKRRTKECPSLKLASAQHQLAREYGFKNWAALARFASFGAGGSSWESESHGGVAHRVAVDQGTVKIEQTGASGVGWHGELRYAPFPVKEGETWEVAFSARFSRSARLSVWIGQYRSPWRSLISDKDRFDDRELGPDWREFAFRAGIVADEPEARLNFVFGGQDGTFSLRNVSLRPILIPPELSRSRRG